MQILIYVTVLMQILIYINIITAACTIFSLSLSLSLSLSGSIKLSLIIYISSLFLGEQENISCQLNLNVLLS